MITTRTTSLIATLALVPVLTLTGCGTEAGNGNASADAASTATGAGAPTQAGAAGSDLKSQLDALAAQARADIAEGYAKKVRDEQARLDKLKADVASYGDEQLNSVVQQIQDVLNQLGGKVDELKNAGQASGEALQADVKKLVNQAGELFKQALTRQTELDKS